MKKFNGIHWSKMPNAEEIKQRISQSKIGQPSPMKGKKHTLQAKEKNRLAHLGKRSGHWKGGIKKVNGYIYLLKKDHPFATKAGYIRRSRLVMEKYMKRYLYLGEIIHHKNGIKTDDRIKNLKLFTISGHIKYHNNFRFRDKNGRFIN